MGLPRFIVLKAQRNDQYLIHLRDDHDYLQFSGTDFGSLHVKFEVVRSSKVDGLVHLKCCYNNKYWVFRPENQWISADAHEMEEDQTKWSCTLFKPVFFTDNRIGLCHVNINKNVIFSDEKSFYLSIGNPSSKEDDYLDLFDWDNLPILPQYIALKGHNELYLSAYKAQQTLDKVPKAVKSVFNFLKWVNPIAWGTDKIIKATDDPNVYLRLNCKDKGDQTVRNEVFITPDNKIRLRNNHTGKFWRGNPNWIWLDSEDETNKNLATLFEVTKVSHNKIALRNVGNQKFCMSVSVEKENKTDCLNAYSTTIPEAAKFLFEELVDKRKIFNVRFHENAVRKYETEILNDVSSTDINNTGAAFQATMEFEYTKEQSRSWTTSNELRQTADIEITVAPPELVVQGKIRYAHEVTETVTNGKTLNEKKVIKFTRTVTVLPNSKVVATFRVLKAVCDIPYSYSQTEIDTNGNPIDTHDRDDGLYTSVQTEVFFNPKEEKISWK